MPILAETDRRCPETDAEVNGASRSDDGAWRSCAAAILELTPDFVFIAEPTGRLQFMNAAARRALGIRPADDLAAMQLDDYVTSSGSGPAFRDTLALAIEAGAWTGETCLVRRDGTQLPVSQTVLVQRGPAGDVERVTLIARDITEQLHNARRLQTRALALEAVSEGILVTAPWRRDNPIVYVNPAFKRLTGYRSHDVLGRNSRMLIGEKTDTAAVEQIENAVRDQRPLKGELLLYRADGSTFWSALSLAVLRDERACMLYCVIMVSDISHQRQMEEHLRQSQKMDCIGRLAGGIAHDFNNLLTVILGSAQRAAKLAGQGQNVLDPIADIGDAAQRAAALTGQLLAFSRKQVVVPQTIDVDVLIDDCSGLVRRLLGEDVSVEVVLAANQGWVVADKSQLEQVLLNLVVNARDAMPEGGTLRIETCTVELDGQDVALHPDAQPGPHVRIAVSDTGVGMTPEVAAHVFEPFFTTKGPGSGTGMGLATVFGVVRQSEGHITLSTEAGRGTTFCIHLPCAPRPVPADGAQKSAPPSARGDETILVVEDEASVLRIARHFLEEAGYRVLSAADGPSACELASRYPGAIDLLLVDVIMPGMNGHEVAARVSQARPGIKILYVSGYTDNPTLRQSIFAREVNFLQKPYQQHSLAQSIRQVLDQPA